MLECRSVAFFDLAFAEKLLYWIFQIESLTQNSNGFTFLFHQLYNYIETVNQKNSSQLCCGVAVFVI